LLDGREIRIDWRKEDETYRFRIESEEEKAAEIRQVEPGVYLVLAGKSVYEARIDGNNVTVGGHTFCAEVFDPRRWNQERNHRHAEGRQNIVASMPGKVVRVMVAVGDEVEAGQGIVVVEAMKMQNEMKAVRAGRVVALSAVPGATVNAGEILAAIE
jgi:biotin carboxyl carrier protein